MSADFNTYISINGTLEDIRKILDILETYVKNENGIYLDDLFFDKKKIIGKVKNNHLDLSFGGPYGRFGMLEEISFPDEMAKAAPDSSFTVNISGFSTGADEAMNAEYKNKQMTMKLFYKPNECGYEDYIKYLKEKITKEEFIDITGCTKDEYSDFIEELAENYGDINSISYVNMLDISEDIKKKDFNKLVKKIKTMDILSYDDFDSDEDYWTSSVYHID